MYFDSHAHYDDKRFNNDRKSLLDNLPKQGVDYVVNIGADMRSSKASVELAENYGYIYATVGVHPHYVKNMKDGDLRTLETYAAHKKVVAIGEAGLDFYRDLSPRELQRLWFKKQIELALKLDLPFIVHSRDASEETMEIIKASGLNRGVIHCYSGSTQMAYDYVKMGFYIGIDGPVTYDNAKKINDVVYSVPMDRLLIETDAPYLTPNPNRGKRNDSTQLQYIVNAIAQIKQMTPESVAEATSFNAKKLFGI